MWISEKQSSWQKKKTVKRLWSKSKSACSGHSKETSWLKWSDRDANMRWDIENKKTLESPLDSKEINPVNPKGNQSRIFIGGTDEAAEAPIFCPPDGKNWLIRKDPDAGKDWRQEEKEMTEDEIVGWHHQLNWHEFEQAPGVGNGQGSLVCCSQWGCKELDTTEQVTELNWKFLRL